jgi:hypothetical protein
MNDEDLRDLFAGLAMQGILAGGGSNLIARETAANCYALADAMLDAKYAESAPEPEMGITAIKRKRKTTKEE